MIELIGYSTADPNVGSAEAREKYYAAVHIKDSEYYSNVIQAKAQILKNMLARLGRSPERNRMDEDPQYVDAYYHFWLNHFSVLAGIVQRPSFTANAPEYLNFGALGMIAGHEISHGFDNFGRNYGPRGELHDVSFFLPLTFVTSDRDVASDLLITRRAFHYIINVAFFFLFLGCNSHQYAP